MPFKLKYNKSGFPFKQTEEDANPYGQESAGKSIGRTVVGGIAGQALLGPAGIALGAGITAIKKWKQKQREKAFNQGYEDSGYDAMEPL